MKNDEQIEMDALEEFFDAVEQFEISDRSDSNANDEQIYKDDIEEFFNNIENYEEFSETNEIIAEPELTKAAKFIHYWTHKSLIRSITDYSLKLVPQQQVHGNYNRKKAIFSQYFPQGMDWGMHGVWPAAVATVIIHDYIKYLINPNERFEVTPLDILLGTNDNEYILGNSWGSNRILDPMFWAGISIVLSLPLLLGITRLLFKLKVDNLSNLELRQFDTMINRYQLGRLRWLLVFHNDLSYQTKDEWCSALIDKNIKLGYWQEIRRVRTAALLWADLKNYGMINSPLKKSERIESGEYEPLNNNEKEQFDIDNEVIKIQNNILNYLTPDESDTQKSRLYRIVNSYYVWSIGREQSRIANTGWISLQLARDGIIAFSFYRIIFSIVQKAITAYQYVLDKTDCENRDMIFKYMNEWGQEHCAACPDLEYIFYPDRDDFSNCLNGLLRYENNTETILKKLPTYLSHIQAPDIDISQQNWYDWGYNIWNQFLDTIEQNSEQLNSLNLSRQILLPVAPNMELVERLGEFLNNTLIAMVNLQNLNLGTAEVNQLVLEQSNNTLTTNFNIGGNHIYGDGLHNFFDVYQNLTEMDLADNNLNSYDLDQVSEYIKSHPNLRSIKIGNNSFYPDSIINFLSVVAESNITYLDISNTDLSQVDFSQVPELVHSKIETLILNNCLLLGEQMRELSLPFNLTFLNMGNNYIDSDGMTDLFYELNNTAIRTVDCSYNQLTGQGLLNIANLRFNSDKPISINISYNPIDQESLIEFFQASPSAAINAISVRGLGLDDETGFVVAQLIDGEYGNNTISQFDLGENNLTSQSIQEVIYVTENSTVSIILKADFNLIDDSAIEALIQTQLKNFQGLDFSYCPIYDKTTLSEMFKIAAKSDLNMFNFSGISAIEDSVAIELASHTVSKTGQMNQLSNRCISSDEAIAINKASSQTNLKSISLSDTSITSKSFRFFCRVSNAADIDPRNYNFQHNSAITTDYCQISAGNSSRQPFGLMPSLILLGFEFTPFIVGLAAIYMVYRNLHSMLNHSEQTSNESRDNFQVRL